MSWPAYPDYKYSGCDWLGNVPTHWNLKRLAQYFDERREKASDSDFQPLSVTMKGIVPRLETAAKTQDGANRKKVCRGDFVINSRSDRKGSAGLSPQDGTVSLINIVLRPKDIQPEFSHHLLRSKSFQEEFYRHGKGIVDDLWSTGFAEMKGIRIAVPSRDEQATIAQFLDYETARIDALIEEQQRLIDLLQEKRRAVISHAIRDHGTKHEGRLGYYMDLLPGYAFPSDKFIYEPGVRLLRGINIGIGQIRWNEIVYWPTDDCVGLEDFELETGDIVIGMDRPWIANGTRVAKVQETDLPALVLQRVARIKPRSGLIADFLYLILSSEIFQDEVEADLTGISVPHISPDQIKSLRIALPSENVQEEICRRVFTELRGISSVIDEATQVIVVLQERRSALMSAAVTGKIDVRGWKPQDAPVEHDLPMAAEAEAQYG